MAGMNTPWWYSGDESTPEEEPQETPAWDPSALLMAANQIVDWATERFVAPHAEHVDPRDYPSCVLCRSATMLGGVTNEPQTPAEPTTPTPMTWIPVRRIKSEE